jgi:hypothetical protein
MPLFEYVGLLECASIVGPIWHPNVVMMVFFFVFCVSCHSHRHAFGIAVVLEIGGLRFALQQRE